jgi:hypothetical protein
MDFAPAFDVDSSVRCQDLWTMVAKFREVLNCFSNPRFKNYTLFIRCCHKVWRLYPS